MPAFLDITGWRFSRLLAIRRAPSSTKHVYWHCRCDCGRKVRVRIDGLRSGAVQSCNCLHVEVARTNATRHNKSRSPTYKSWGGMISRCTNQNLRQWKDYGGRGITVCARWLSFENFLADMGERPAGLTLDRINNDGNYEPGNCRWATRSEQQRNRRRKKR